MKKRKNHSPEFKARVATQGAALHVPDPHSDRDALIAATGITHAMSIVTRNVADFEPTGVQIINPWEPMK